MTAWAVLAIQFSSLPQAWMRTLAAVVWGLLAIVTLLFAARSPSARRKSLVLFGVLWLPIAAWIWSIPPSNEGEWQPEVERLATAEVDGDRLTVHNVRNFIYRSTTDFDARWESRTYDLTKLRGVDVFFSDWGKPLHAHLMVSFEFDDPTNPGGASYLCLSIASRKRKGMTHSEVKCVFKQYTVVCTAGDERDLIGVRTHFRRERVYLYRLDRPAAYTRAMLMAYVDRMNGLAAKPEWFNAFTNNCFGTFRFSTADVHGSTMPWHEILFRGLLIHGGFDAFMYAEGEFSTSLAFAELKRQSQVNAKVDASPIGPDFSAKLRAGLPAPLAAPTSPAGRDKPSNR